MPSDCCIRFYKTLCELKIRHIVIRRRMKEDGSLEWRAIEDECYSSVRELIDNYMASGRPLNPE
ncbi:unnamed protein product, partial [Anisakis simplex]